MPTLIAAPCAPTIRRAAHDDRLRLERHRRRRRLHPQAAQRADSVSLVAWSLGGPRAGGYAAQHPRKCRGSCCSRPAYNRDGARSRRRSRPRRHGLQHAVARRVHANWDRQVGCPEPVRSAVRDAVWAEMLASDPVGATWGTGVRRAPSTTTWGWNAGDGRRNADADADGRRRPRQAGAARRACASSTTISASRRRCSSISAARRTTRCGRRTTCCCSGRRSNGSPRARSTARRGHAASRLRHQRAARGLGRLSARDPRQKSATHRHRRGVRVSRAGRSHTQAGLEPWRRCRPRDVEPLPFPGLFDGPCVASSTWAMNGLASWTRPASICRCSR